MNDELQDFEMKSGDSAGPQDAGSQGTRRWLVWTALAVLALAIAAILWFRRDRPEEQVPLEQPEVPTVTEAAEAGEPQGRLDLGEIPPLIDSDEWLREVVAQVSSHPQLAEWLVTPELIRGFVVVVDNIAEGTSPAKHLAMAEPEGEFRVQRSDETAFIDPASYDRFDLLIDVISSLDAEGTAELYRAIRPLCEQAYQDLGYPGGEFDATLRRAIDRVLATPIVEGPVAVERKVTAYEFADPELEGLSPAAKQLLRLGPENLERLQTKLQELARAIDLEP